MRRILWAVAIWSLARPDAALAGSSGPLVNVNYQYAVIQTATSPVIDGVPDPVFLSAPKITIQSFTGSASCDFYFLWDDTAMYGAAQCADADLEADVPAASHDDDGIWDDDGVEIMFDPARLGGNELVAGIFKLVYNARGAKLESEGVSYDWNPAWTLVSVVNGTLNNGSDTDTGYTVEWRIPWSEWPRTAPVPGENWGMNISLNDRGSWGSTVQTFWTSAHVNIPAGAGLFRFADSHQVLGLSWVSAPTASWQTNSSDNLAGTLLCSVLGSDRLKFLTITNQGTAQAVSDISNLKVWYQAVSGSASLVGAMTPAGDAAWSLSADYPLQDGDRLLLTADVPPTPQDQRTCRLALPVEGARFATSWPREYSVLTSQTEQIIRYNQGYNTEFSGPAFTNLLQGTKAVNLGRIGIQNQSGSALLLSDLQLGVTDEQGRVQNPDLIFEKLQLENQGRPVAALSRPFGYLGTFHLITPESIPNQNTLYLSLTADFRTAPQSRTFRVGLMDRQCLNRGEVLAFPPAGSNFPLLSRPLQVQKPDLASAFQAYPNPFRPDREELTVLFYLDRPARVALRFMTLDKSLVKAGEWEKGGGLQTILWDGRNENGRAVKSGVYLVRLEAVFADGTRAQAVTKVSILR